MKTEIQKLSRLFDEIHSEVDPLLALEVKSYVMHYQQAPLPRPARVYVLPARRSKRDFSPKFSDRMRTSVPPSQPGEMIMKEFIARKAAEFGVSWQAYYNRLWKIRFAGLKLRRVNARVVFVRPA